MAQKYSSPEKSSGDPEDEMSSCWGRFVLILSRKRGPRKSRKAKNSSSCFSFSKSGRRAQQFGAFRYSPLSYAQNFDEGHEWEDDDQDAFFRGFSSRYAVPVSSSADSNHENV
ncbi:hypothetical protein Sango_2148400 [Sesamum angolense]|uniref:Uncharacterized protein n=1 Tax=Sesamum angolense TaxID=2727404 RepID=A0AAE1WCK9_9LAMI|nr:hypothetical protein Sango_2148400 [Sesamum angolense]